MVVLKTSRELGIMKEACRISAGALQTVGNAVEPGITTAELDALAEKYIRSQGGEPNFKNYHGYPATACISINNEVIHGIPSKKRVLKAGDIVSVDLGARFNGYNGDNAATFACGDVSAEAKRLMQTTKDALYEGIRKMLTTEGMLEDYANRASERGKYFSTEKTTKAAEKMLMEL